MTRLGRAIGPGSLRKVKRGGGPAQWVLEYTTSDGSRRREALSTDRSVAERRRAEIIRQRDLEVAGLGAVEGQSRPLAELRDLYLDDLQHRATPMHVVNTRQKLDRVLARVPAKRVRDLKPYDLMKLRNELLTEGLAVRTVNLHVDVVRAMLGWAVSAGLIAENPIEKLKRLPENETTKRRRRRALSDDEIARFLAAAEEDDRRCAARLSAERSKAGAWMTKASKAKPRPARVPQAPLWMALLETGSRWSELISATWADVDLDQATLRLRAENTKSRRQRVIPLRHEMVEVLRGLRVSIPHRVPGPHDRVFLSPEGKPWCRQTNRVTKIFDRVMEIAEIDKVDGQGRQIDVHALRGSCASRLARRGVPLVMTQRILGHSTVEMTARHYVHTGVEDLREAVERAEAAPSSAKRSAG